MDVNGREVAGLIFDFDGTLADSMWVWDEVDRFFFRKRDLVFDAEAVESIAVLGFEGGADYVIDRYGLDETPDEIIAEWKDTAHDRYATQVMLKEGAGEYLRRCHERGMPMAVATSLQRNLLEPSLANNGVLELFDAICVCDELGCGGKSNPAVYEEAASQMGVAVSECAIFEDVVTPARSAKKTGAYVVGVYDEHKQQASDALRETCDWFIESWEELL